MGKVVDMTIALFVRRIAPHIDPSGIRGVTRVPELDRDCVAFMKELPDRLLAGEMAFAVMRSRGVPEVALEPGEYLRRVSLPPARPERYEAFRVPGVLT